MLFLLACSSPDTFTVSAPPSELLSLQSYFKPIEHEGFNLEEAGSEKETCKRGEILLLLESAHAECYQISSSSSCAVVRGDKLGLQYGLSALLEEMGFGFYHPYQTHIPTELQLPERETEWICPEMSLRGLHLHTLHPIEGYYDMWEPNSSGRVEQTIDWLIKNRGNHLQWVALEEMPSGWQDHTQKTIELAHERGITVGLGIQLFSDANLQKAFNLVDNSAGDLQEQMNRSFQKLTPLGFDLYNLSFGEFFSSEPEAFIESIDLAYRTLQEQAPEAEMSTVIHVGKDLQVSYQGEEYIYYMLAQFANPEITPWVHTVMYYNLYDSAGGAYHHDAFDEHRAFIEAKLAAKEKVAYFPESAYWVAFDNSVPQFFPVYIHSRWKDMARLQGLQEHVLFSSGWEWGYWLNDVMTLRMNWAVPDDYRSLLSDLLEPIGEPELALAVADLASLQHEALIVQELGAWMCGVDIAMEVGFNLDIIAQPPRPAFSALEEEHLLIADALDELALETKSIFNRPNGSSHWGKELADGIEIDHLRASFMALLIRAAVNEDPTSLDAARLLLEEAQVVVARRHEALWDPNPERLINEGDNSTLYQFGYLLRSEELCFWEREALQVESHIMGISESIPGCNL